jgi:hypothetical protein
MEFEPTIPATARPQTHALDRAATGIGLTIETQKCVTFVKAIRSYVDYFSNAEVLYGKIVE